MLIKLEDIISKYKIKINGILHIGAHLCEEKNIYNKIGINDNKIIWIEANPDLVNFNKIKNPNINIKNFICCDKNDGYTTLNIANNGQSSSILELGTHSNYYPVIKYTNKISVKNKRIDDMYKEDKIPNNFANFLNIDIQGAELLAIKGMGNIINNFDCIYLEVNKDYVYKKCCLVSEIDNYLLKFNFKRVETKWTTHNWGDALYLKFNNNYKIIKNARCSKEIWQFKGTFQEALKKAKNDPRVTALHWLNFCNSGDGRIENVIGYYQGASDSIGSIKNNHWDTILINNEDLIFDIGSNIGNYSISNINKCNKIISIEASPNTYKRLIDNTKIFKKIIPLNYAVCNNNCNKIKFYEAKADVLSTINKDWLTNINNRFYNQPYNEIICDTITIDLLIKKYGMPSLIKIDVEGGEYECISSLSQKVPLLCFEWASETNNISIKCLNYLIKLGFTQFYIQYSDNFNFRPSNSYFKNYEFIKNELLKTINKKDWGMIWCK